MIQYRMHFKTEQSHFFNTKNELLDIINKLTMDFWLMAYDLNLKKSEVACSEKKLKLNSVIFCGYRRKQIPDSKI